MPGDELAPPVQEPLVLHGLHFLLVPRLERVDQLLAVGEGDGRRDTCTREGRLQLLDLDDAVAPAVGELTGAGEPEPDGLVLWVGDSARKFIASRYLVGELLADRLPERVEVIVAGVELLIVDEAAVSLRLEAPLLGFIPDLLCLVPPNLLARLLALCALIRIYLRDALIFVVERVRGVFPRRLLGRGPGAAEALRARAEGLHGVLPGAAGRACVHGKPKIGVRGFF